MARVPSVVVATLFLHIGTSKAGSTALQQFLSHNRGRLIEHGLEYGPVFSSTNHLDLAAAFCSRSTRVAHDFGVTSEAHRHGSQRRLARRFEARVAQDARWIISSEHLGTLLTRPDDIAALGTFLRRSFDRIVVLVVLRRATHWLPSAYVESIRGGSTKLLDSEYVVQRRRLLNHRRLIQRWQEGLRPDQIAAVPYLESDKADPSALSLRMLTALGVGGVERGFWSTPSQLSNISMSAYATEVLRQANPFLHAGWLGPAVARRRAIAFVSSTWPGRGPTLTEEAASHLNTLGLDDVTIARSAYAVGEDWDSWVAQPPPPVLPQTALSETERAEAFGLLRRQGLIEDSAVGGPPAMTARWVGPLRRARHKLGRSARRAVESR